jgi:SseB protein N-terminal domain
VAQLSAGDPRFRTDCGDADLAVTAALARYAACEGTEHAVLTALARSRLLVPVIAVAADELSAGDADELARAGGGTRQASAGAERVSAGAERATAGAVNASEMAVPAIVGHDGRRALPAFTSLETLQRWQPDARPVPVPATGVWQSAAQDAQAVIIDIAGPVPLVVEGARLAALASGAPVPQLHEDPDVRAIVAAAAASQPPGIRIRLGPAEDDSDLTLELAPADTAADAAAPRPMTDEVARAFLNDVAAGLAGRARRGIALVVRPG